MLVSKKIRHKKTARKVPHIHTRNYDNHPQKIVLSFQTTTRGGGTAGSPHQEAAGNCKVEDAQSSKVLVITAIAGYNEDIYQLRIFDYSCSLISSQTPDA